MCRGKVILSDKEYAYEILFKKLYYFFVYLFSVEHLTFFSKTPKDYMEHSPDIADLPEGLYNGLPHGLSDGLLNLLKSTGMDDDIPADLPDEPPSELPDELPSELPTDTESKYTESKYDGIFEDLPGNQSEEPPAELPDDMYDAYDPAGYQFESKEEVESSTAEHSEHSEYSQSEEGLPGRRPVCTSCGKILAHKYTEYEKLKNATVETEKLSEGEILTYLGLNCSSCRIAVLSSVNNQPGILWTRRNPRRAPKDSDTYDSLV
jgi:DNA-directed RNA polymerase subunit N (RpoN/RPB10)